MNSGQEMKREEIEWRQTWIPEADGEGYSGDDYRDAYEDTLKYHSGKFSSPMICICHGYP